MGFASEMLFSLIFFSKFVFHWLSLIYCPQKQPINTKSVRNCKRHHFTDLSESCIGVAEQQKFLMKFTLSKKLFVVTRLWILIFFHEDQGWCNALAKCAITNWWIPQPWSHPVFGPFPDYFLCHETCFIFHGQFSAKAFGISCFSS